MTVDIRKLPLAVVLCLSASACASTSMPSEQAMQVADAPSPSPTSSGDVDGVLPHTSGTETATETADPGPQVPELPPVPPEAAQKSSAFLMRGTVDLQTPTFVIPQPDDPGATIVRTWDADVADTLVNSQVDQSDDGQADYGLEAVWWRGDRLLERLPIRLTIITPARDGAPASATSLDALRAQVQDAQLDDLRTLISFAQRNGQEIEWLVAGRIADLVDRDVTRLTVHHPTLGQIAERTADGPFEASVSWPFDDEDISTGRVAFDVTVPDNASAVVLIRSRGGAVAPLGVLESSGQVAVDFSAYPLVDGVTIDAIISDGLRWGYEARQDLTIGLLENRAVGFGIRSQQLGTLTPILSYPVGPVTIPAGGSAVFEPNVLIGLPTQNAGIIQSAQPDGRWFPVMFDLAFDRRVTFTNPDGSETLGPGGTKPAVLSGEPGAERITVETQGLPPGRYRLTYFATVDGLGTGFIPIDITVE